ncbi:MAG: hypothetical protein ACI9MB_002409 [Verrucomicrobiales bacterium]
MTRSSTTRTLTILLAALLVTGHAIAAPDELFKQRVAPFLELNCTDCHDDETQKGKVSLHTLDGDFSNGDTVAMWERVLEQLEIGVMPPEKKTQPTATEREEIVSWIKQGLTTAGKGFELESRRLLPEFGNRVSHELLFDGSIRTLPFTPSRLWRISPHIYGGRKYQQLVAGGIEAQPVSYKSKSSGLRDYADQEIMDEAGFLALQLALSDIIANQIHDRELTPMTYGPNKGKPISIAGKESFKAISEAEGKPSRKVLEKVIREEFERASGRPIGEDEFSKYLAFMQRNLEQGGNEAGLKTTLLGIYLSPEAVYRLELGRGPADEHGRHLLSPQEIAFALSYALTDSPPTNNQIIHQAYETGKLTNKTEVEEVVRAMIAAGAPPIRKHFPASAFHRMIQEGEHGFAYYPRIVRFFEEFFLYPKAEGTFKDSPGPGMGGRALIGAPQGHIAAIINEDTNVFEELLTSPRFNNSRTQLMKMVDERYTQKLKSGPKDKADAWRANLVKHSNKLTNDTFRAGMLHDLSWLITHSTNDANDPVHRGIWVRTHLLAGNVPALPIGVDAKIPEAHDKTLRQRFAVTKANECWKCHKHFEPLGMPFESFTDRGWVRTGMYYNKKQKRFETMLTPDKIQSGLDKGELVEHLFDTSGEITGTGEPGVDGPVKDANDLVTRLAKSTRVRQSIIRHCFRYWMGRNEMLSDSKTLIAAEKAYLDSGGKFSELLVSLLTSDSFLYRK